MNEEGRIFNEVSGKLVKHHSFGSDVGILQSGLIHKFARGGQGVPA